MGIKRKQILIQQKAYFEQKLKDRLSLLSEKGIKSPKTDKDTLVRNLKGAIRAANRRLRRIADIEKRTEDMAKAKAERAAAPRKEQEGGKAAKAKKAPEEGKGKKPKAAKKSTSPKAPEESKDQKKAESQEEGKAARKKEAEEPKEGPEGHAKTDK